MIDASSIKLGPSCAQVCLDRARGHRVESDTHLVIPLERLISSIRTHLRRGRRIPRLSGLISRTFTIFIRDLSINTNGHIENLEIELIRIIQDNTHVLGVITKGDVSGCNRLTLQGVMMQFGIRARQEHLVVICARRQQRLITGTQKHHRPSLRRIDVDTYHLTVHLRTRRGERLGIQRGRAEFLLTIGVRRYTGTGKQRCTRQAKHSNSHTEPFDRMRIKFKARLKCLELFSETRRCFFFHDCCAITIVVVINRRIMSLLPTFTKLPCHNRFILSSSYMYSSGAAYVICG